MARIRHSGEFPGFCTLVWMLLAALSVQAKDQKADQKEDWPPISKEELALKDNPANPGAPAMILFREIFTDDQKGFRTEYYRIKILKDEGKKHADIEIPFFKGFREVEDIEARTVHADGKVVDFEGDVYEKTVLRIRGVKFLAKTFTLPDVQMGSVIEYSYKLRWAPPASSSLEAYAWLLGLRLSSLRTTEWVIQDNLFTRRARFSFRPVAGRRVMWTWQGLTRSPERQADGVIQLEVENVPAFQKEEYMPPESALKSRVDFFYLFAGPDKFQEKSTAWFWKEQGVATGRLVDSFTKKHKAVDREVDDLVGSNEPPETKLRKLYSRAQQIRNLSYESEKTIKEERREKLKENQNIEDVLKHGYGSGLEINLLFMTMARSAGFDGWLVKVAPRDKRFFNPSLLDPSQLSANVVDVRVGSKDLYFDPATLHCPFGLVPWEDAGVTGYRVEEDGGAAVTTPMPAAAETVIQRKATFELGEGRTLKGRLQVSFTGQEALERRFDAREMDEAGRRKELEDEAKAWLPAGATVNLTSASGWESSDQALEADFTVEVTSFGVLTGRRLLLPMTVFESREPHHFQSVRRTYSVYFHYPYEEVDDVALQLPKGYRLESLPEPRNIPSSGFGKYEISGVSQSDGLHLRRHLVIQTLLIPVEYYASLRDFFITVRSGDESQFVLQTTEVGKLN